MKEESTGFAANALGVNVRERNESTIIPKYLASENIASERMQLPLNDMERTRKLKIEE